MSKQTANYCWQDDINSIGKPKSLKNKEEYKIEKINTWNISKFINGSLSSFGII